MTITIKEVSLEEAFEVNKTITEFNNYYSLDYFKEKTKGKEKLVLVAYTKKFHWNFLNGV